MKKYKSLPFLALLCGASFSASSYAQERIISAGANITELVIALGAEQQLVAVDVTSRHLINEQNVPQVGYHRQLSAEGLMALNPSYLIGSAEMGPEKTLSQLQASAVTVTVVPSGHRIAELNQRIDLIAAITGTQTQAIPLKQQASDDIAQLQKNVRLHATGTHPKVLFLMLNASRPATVAGAETSIDTVITLAGGRNPAASMMSYKPISYEAIIAMQPDYILVSQRSWDSFGGQQAILRELPLLAATPAARNNNIIAINGSAIIGGFGLASIALAAELSQQFIAE